MSVTLRQSVDEAPGITSFYLDYDRTRVQYKASQVFHLHADFAHDADAYRPFSIASSPTEDTLLFTMRMRSDSPYKQSLAQRRPGDELVVVGPVGRFTLPPDNASPIVFLGGGIGITPFRSMIKFATDRQLPHRITLLYSTRTPEEIVYRGQWAEFQRLNPNLTVVHTVTRPQQSQEEWTGRVGRIDAALVHEYVPDPANALFYLCGTPAFIRGMATMLRAMQVGTNRILVDVFWGYD